MGRPDATPARRSPAVHRGDAADERDTDDVSPEEIDAAEAVGRYGNEFTLGTAWTGKKKVTKAFRIRAQAIAS